MGTFESESSRKSTNMTQMLALLSLIGLSASKSLAVGEVSLSNRMSAGTNFTGQEKAAAQGLVCYDYKSGGGDSVRAIDYIPALRNYNFDNRVSSCCFTGTWILYAEENYNGYSTGAANWWAFGDNYCIDVPSQFDNVASSLRFTELLTTGSTTPSTCTSMTTSSGTRSSPTTTCPSSTTTTEPGL